MSPTTILELLLTHSGAVTPSAKPLTASTATEVITVTASKRDLASVIRVSDEV
ncbi:hypothetical protein M404DRAFT_1004911 [Pisolithus tinctorius Marx 270]|uniref:Uncharacterized protein n=1 Tax=Pisolithus tinctorius Marx 270 TaxID=870435 RepID=A0A0C3IQN3_PISTI|nr:hypothetical protein M404DRAFT_1004911 [Pisolithus tinctorius Marx 270]